MNKDVWMNHPDLSWNNLTFIHSTKFIDIFSNCFYAITDGLLLDLFSGKYRRNTAGKGGTIIFPSMIFSGSSKENIIISKVVCPMILSLDWKASLARSKGLRHRRGG
jgi:hypothetical protein